MIELEPIKQIKSPNSENVIIFALRCANYMVINDKIKVKRAIKSSDQIFDYGRLRDIDKQWVDLLIGN